MGIGGAIGLAGLALGSSAVMAAGRRWVRQMETPPSELAKQHWNRARVATAAGVGAWRTGSRHSRWAHPEPFTGCLITGAASFDTGGGHREPRAMAGQRRNVAGGDVQRRVHPSGGNYRHDQGHARGQLPGRDHPQGVMPSETAAWTIFPWRWRAGWRSVRLSQDRVTGGADEPARSRAMAVRGDVDLPLPVRPRDDRAGIPDRAAADRVVPGQARRVSAG